MTAKQTVILIILIIYMAANMIIGIKSSKAPSKDGKKDGFL